MSVTSNRWIKVLGTILDQTSEAFLVFLSSSISTLDPDEKEMKQVLQICTHVVYCEYTYANYLRRAYTTYSRRKVEVRLESLKDVEEAMRTARNYFQQSVEYLKQVPVAELREQFVTSWGQRFDCEQMIEHAIVHLLRHQNQIQQILTKIS